MGRASRERARLVVGDGNRRDVIAARVERGELRFDQPAHLRASVDEQVGNELADFLRLGVEASLVTIPFEVDLKLSARATRADEPVFHVEVVYGGLFAIENVPAEDLEPVLLVECPRFLFPFARRLIADVSGEGGFPPFLIDPIDFGAVYAARKAQGGMPDPVGNA